MKSRWNIIHTYHIYDILAIIFVLTIIIEECGMRNRYSLDRMDQLISPIIIILGLGWGLLSQMIFGPHQRKTRIENPKT
jgi:hypothetical protein